MDKNKVFAYDFWDTVVHRNCHPEQIIFEWSKNISRYLGFDNSPSVIYELRKKTENELKKEKEEPTYEEILKIIYKKLEITKKTWEEFYTFCVDEEFQIELMHICLDELCVNEIEKRNRDKEIVILISDFYLGKDFIKRILEQFKIINYFKYIFVSSDVNKRKSTGNLYRHVISTLKITPDLLYMQGDNYSSDVIIPRKLEINSNYRKYENRFEIINTKKMKKNVKKILFSDIRRNALSGYAGEVLYFISLLYKELYKRGVKKVLFCSREGQLLKKLFDMYQMKIWGDEKIKTEYFYVSRRATILPSLEKFENEDFSIIFRQFKKIKLSDFLNSIGFYEKEICKISNECDVSLDDYISIDKCNEPYKKLSSCSSFLKLYNEKRLNQRTLFYRYLKQIGYSLCDEKITIVDIGWKGTIQDCIQRSLPSGCIVEGYYLGLRTKEFGCINRNLKHGILFYDYPDKCKNYDVLEYNYMFYERIFVANHGPVIGYEMKNNLVVPIIKNDNDELLLFNFMIKFQEKLLNAFDKLLNLFVSSRWEAYELYGLMIQNLLWRQCVYFPKIWKIEKTAREISKENFGDISKNQRVKKEILGKEQFKKKKFLFVDYTFRILERYKLKFLYPIAELYCRFIYFIKKIGLE